MTFQAVLSIGEHQPGDVFGLIRRVTAQTGGVSGLAVLNGVLAVTEGGAGKIILAEAHRVDLEAVFQRHGVAAVAHLVA